MKALAYLYVCIITKWVSAVTLKKENAALSCRQCAAAHPDIYYQISGCESRALESPDDCCIFQTAYFLLLQLHIKHI